MLMLACAIKALPKPDKSSSCVIEEKLTNNETNKQAYQQQQKTH